MKNPPPVNLHSLLTILPDDYQSLITGETINLLCIPYKLGQQFIIVPKKEPNFNSQHFIEFTGTYPIKDEQSKAFVVQHLNITETELKAYYQHFQTKIISLLTVRVNIFTPAQKVQPSPKLGHKPLLKSIAIEQYRPILDDYNFEKLCNDPNYRLAPLTQLIPDLQNLALTEPRTDNFLALIQADQQEKPRPLQPIPDWIKNEDIIRFGKGSQEEDQNTDSNHAQGTRFEKIVRQALEYLGFTVDYEHKGGSGGLDFFISKPYPIIGECKSGETVPVDTPTQLIRLGITKLKIDCLSNCVKLIIAAGKPTTKVTEFAKESETCIMNSQTLQKLVALHAHYPGAVNLEELKEYLVPGAAEKEIDQYVQKIYQQISLRRSIVELVKTLQERTHQKHISLDEIWGAYAGGNHQLRLDRSKLLSILIELSSPLIGCLGRYETKQRRFQDFYHCRDLPNPQEIEPIPGADQTP